MKPSDITMVVDEAGALPGQLALIGPEEIVWRPEGARNVRRVWCHGGCGRWWYYDGSQKPGKKRAGGRPRSWCPDCYPVHRMVQRARKKAQRAVQLALPLVDMPGRVVPVLPARHEGRA